MKISESSEDLEVQLTKLFREYSDALQLTTPYNPDIVVGSDTTKVATFEQAFIEITDATYVHRTKKEVKRIKVMQQGVPIEGFQERVLEQGWTIEKS